jgi:CheY-like chemotaxis protein/HEAT repeat protein
MSILENFRHSDFAEQITILSRIQADNLGEAIPDLFDLYRQPLQDTMVDHLVVTGLQSLLAGNENETVMRIKSGNMREKALCINIAGIHHFASAVPLLHSLLRNDQYKELHTESFFALGEIKSPESLGLFREYIHHADEVLASLAMQMVGQYRDEDSIETLLAFIEQAEKVEEYETCSLQVGMAVEALAAIRTEKSISYLVSRIHHRNATIRRIIHDALVKIGAATIPLLATVFDGSDTDSKILAANILGLIGSKLGGEVMVRALDAEKANDPNVRYAIYEAFGRIPFLKGLTCLIDALQSDDDLILMAVLTALENQVSPGVIAKLKEIIDEGGTHRGKIIRALVSVKAVHMFKNLYADEKIAQAMMAEIAQTGDPDVIAVFKTALAMMEGAAAKADLAKLSAVVVAETGRDVLVADDSRAMLSFYKSVSPDLGLKIQTAGNGREALDLMEAGQSFDLIITDMNMPVMDGLELTRKIRQKIGNTKIPIIMVTTESEQAQRDMARTAGVDSFITKPFTAAVLKEKLNSFLISDVSISPVGGGEVSEEVRQCHY